MRQIVHMLSIRLSHGDLSEFNVLVDAQGPVIIDLPQAVNAAGDLQADSVLTGVFAREGTTIDPDA